MPKFKPCRVTVQGTRYEIDSTGTAHEIDPLSRVTTDLWEDVERERTLSEPESAIIRAEATRQRKNRDAHRRAEAMRDLGMKRTAYGWE